MNLVSLLILPAIITTRNDDATRFAIAGAALVGLLVAIAFSKRQGGAFAEESDEVAVALTAEGEPAGASAGE